MEKYRKRFNIKHLLIIILVLVIVIAVIISVNQFSFKKEYQPPTALADELPNRFRFIDMDNTGITSDANKDGINDQEDIMLGAKKQLENPAKNINIEEGENNYFNDGDPPENLAISEDIIARAFSKAGFSLKDLVYEDIKYNFDQYQLKENWDQNVCDRNIDYRRIRNLEIFFERNAKDLDILFNASDEQNLNSWLPGDVVFFDMDRDGDSDNVGIISDNTTRDGVPKVIYNYKDPGYTVEKDILKEKIITGHYRFPK